MHVFARPFPWILGLALLLSACGGSSGSGSSGPTEPPPAFATDGHTIALWHLDEGSGQTALDAGLNLAHLQLGQTGVGDAMDPSWSAAGHIGPCLAFTAAADPYATLGTPRVFQTNAFSVELWFRATSPTGQLFEAGPDVFVVGWGGALFFFSINDGSTEHTATITDPTELARLTDGLWHYLAATYDGTTMRIYVDGYEKASITTNPIPPSVTALYLGGHPSGGKSIDGEIDDVRISSSARSATEIEAHWAASVPTATASVGR